MKIKIRPDDTSALQENDWLQTDGWLAELRDDGRADPAGDGHARPARGSDPWPEVLAEAAARAQAEADARAQAEADARAQAEARAEMTGRAVIGDQLRMPVMWCEMGSCISWHADPAALGEADTRARAIGAGWRIDALGRLACPRCQQNDPAFWATDPVVLWDRYTAIVRVAFAAAVSSGGLAGTAGEAAVTTAALPAAIPRQAAARKGRHRAGPGPPGWP